MRESFKEAGIWSTLKSISFCLWFLLNSDLWISQINDNKREPKPWLISGHPVHSDEIFCPVFYFSRTSFCFLQWVNYSTLRFYILRLRGPLRRFTRTEAGRIWGSHEPTPTRIRRERRTMTAEEREKTIQLLCSMSMDECVVRIVVENMSRVVYYTND